MNLYQAANEVVRGIRRFVNDQGTDHSMMLGELDLYGCNIDPMLAGRALRAFEAQIANECRSFATVSYNREARRIRVDPPDIGLCEYILATLPPSTE